MINSEYSISYERFISEWLDESVDEIEAHTSGSTGKPKAIRLSKKMMRESARRTNAYFNIDSGWLLGSCISPAYIGGKMMAVRALEASCRFFCEEPSNHPDILPARKATDRNVLISVVPSQMWHILELGLSEAEKRRIRFLIGGSAIPADLRKRIVEGSIKAWESYGMTETSSHIALRPITSDETLFTPLPGIKLSKSPSGTLAIDLGNSENPIITNDLVEFGSDGNFKILGRADNVIVTGGLKVIPELLEEKIRKIISKTELATNISGLMVTSRPDSKWGEAIVLNLEITPGLSGDDTTLIPESEILIKEVEDAIRDKSNDLSYSILRHEFPKEIRCVRALPRTPNGKLRR